MSEIFSTLKKQIPKKNQKVGCEELPHLYAITPGEREGTHHFHFQYGSRSKRYTFVKRNVYNGSVQLTCFHLHGKVKCTARVKVTVNNALIIKKVGERVSKEKKKSRVKPIYEINWDLPEAKDPKNWTVVPTSAIPHSCNPVHRFFAVRDVFRSLNTDDPYSFKKDQ